MNIKYIQVLDQAELDLEDGRSFYNNQEQGIGEYFWDSLISDIESLIIYAGVHTKEYGYFRMISLKDFRIQFIMKLRIKLPMWLLYCL